MSSTVLLVSREMGQTSVTASRAGVFDLSLIRLAQAVSVASAAAKDDLQKLRNSFSQKTCVDLLYVGWTVRVCVYLNIESITCEGPCVGDKGKMGLGSCCQCSTDEKRSTKQPCRGGHLVPGSPLSAALPHAQLGHGDPA